MLRHYSRGAVAQMLHISAAREAEVEHSALVELQASARHGNCGGTSLAVIQVPAQNRLVAVDPILMSGSQVLSSARTLGGASGTSRSRRTSGRGRGAPVIQEAALGRVPTSNSTAGPWVFGVLVLLGALALLSAAGRRLSEGRPLAMAASVGVLPVVEPAGHGVLGRDDAPVTAPASDQSTAAQAPTFPTPSHGTAPQVLQRASGQERKPHEPGSAPAPTPASGRAYSRMSWLRTHGSQIALVLTVVTGGALRFMARDRGGRRR